MKEISSEFQQANPHKWKKYSLDDADISDRTNASAAFAFLAEMERRKDSEDELAMDTGAANESSSSGKILFKRQTNRSKEWQKPSFNKSVPIRKQIECSDGTTNETVASAKPTLKGSKVIMPEYVIGKKISSTKTKRNKLDTSGETSVGDAKSSKQQNQKPHLQHLFDAEEDDDEDDEMNND